MRPLLNSKLLAAAATSAVLLSLVGCAAPSQPVQEKKPAAEQPAGEVAETPKKPELELQPNATWVPNNAKFAELDAQCGTQFADNLTPDSSSAPNFGQFPVMRTNEQVFPWPESEGMFSCLLKFLELGYTTEDLESGELRGPVQYQVHDGTWTLSMEARAEGSSETVGMYLAFNGQD